MREQKSSPRVLTLVCAAFAAVACGSGTAPDPGEDFRLDVQNHINQMGADSTAKENYWAVFYVRAPTYISPGDLAQILAMQVVWPDSALVTPVQPDFQRTADGLTASEALRQDGVLVGGTYTLKVGFGDGRHVRQQTEYDGHLIGHPLVRSLLPSPGGVALTWVAPSVPHTYRLLLQAGNTTSTSSVEGQTSGGETITLSVHHTLSAGVSYQLVLLMYDEDNQRAVYIPFDYPGS
jgi:hypothetical protein